MRIIPSYNILMFLRCALQKGYGIRIKGMHFITSSTFISLFVSLVKLALSAKLRQRIHVHKKFEDLYEFVPKDILPVEYGGKERSLLDIYGKYVRIYFFIFRSI